MRRSLAAAVVSTLICVVPCLFVWLALGAGSATAEEELRTWSDRSGKHKIEAKFKEVVDGKVTLVRKDGSQMEIALKKLSDEDQKYVAGREEEDDPFKAKSDAGGSSAADADSDEDSDSDKPTAGRNKGKSAAKPLKTIEPDWSKANTIANVSSSDGWKLTVPAVAERAQLKARAMALPPDLDHDRETEMIVSPSASHALVGSVVNGRHSGPGRHRSSRHTHTSSSSSMQNGVVTHHEESSVTSSGGGGGSASDENSVTRLTLCDLVKGKALGTGTMQGNYIPLALDEGGSRVLVREEKFGFDDKALELWDLTSSGPKAVVRWMPALMGEKNSEVNWGAFLSDDRAVTINKSGGLVLWKVKTGEPIAYVQIGGACDPAITADRRYLIFGAKQRVGVLDLNSVELVAETPTESLHSASFALSPDGSRFACLSTGTLNIWNFADGTRLQQVPLAGQDPGREVIWPHDKYLLLGKSRVFDIENQVVLWNYRGAQSATMAGPFCLFWVRPRLNDAGALVLATVPQPILQRALDDAMQAPDFFVLSPGTKVKLTVDAIPDGNEREKIRTALTEKLTANGCQIAPEGAIELVASIDSKSVEQSFRKLGRVPPTSAKIQTYHLQEFTSRLAFMFQEKPAWQMQAVSIPHLLMAKRGQTIEAALHETEKPNYDFLARVALPKRLIKPMPEAALGTSNVTNGGIQ